MMSEYFHIARGTIMEILQSDLALKKLSRPWVLHKLSSSQKADCINRSRALLHRLQQLQPFEVEGMTTGAESWFRYEYESDSMFAPSADMILSRRRAGFQVKKTMIQQSPAPCSSSVSGGALADRRHRVARSCTERRRARTRQFVEDVIEQRRSRRRLEIGLDEVVLAFRDVACLETVRDIVPIPDPARGDALQKLQLLPSPTDRCVLISGQLLWEEFQT
jgi:hypothetical protein